MAVSEEDGGWSMPTALNGFYHLFNSNNHLSVDQSITACSILIFLFSHECQLKRKI